MGVHFGGVTFALALTVKLSLPRIDIYRNGRRLHVNPNPNHVGSGHLHYAIVRPDDEPPRD